VTSVRSDAPSNIERFLPARAAIARDARARNALGDVVGRRDADAGATRRALASMACVFE
jgi:hypothetical protein